MRYFLKYGFSFQFSCFINTIVQASRTSNLFLYLSQFYASLLIISWKWGGGYPGLTMKFDLDEFINFDTIIIVDWSSTFFSLHFKPELIGWKKIGESIRNYFFNFCIIGLTFSFQKIFVIREVPLTLKQKIINIVIFFSFQNFIHVVMKLKLFMESFSPFTRTIGMKRSDFIEFGEKKKFPNSFITPFVCSIVPIVFHGM